MTGKRRSSRRSWLAGAVAALASGGRQLAGLSLRADFGKPYFSELAPDRVWGDVYGNPRDRDSASIVGLNF